MKNIVERKRFFQMLKLTKDKKARGKWFYDTCWMRNRARNFSIGAVALGGVLAMVCSCVKAPGQLDRQTGALGLGREYHVVHGWAQLPEGEMLGEVVGVGVDSHDDVFVFYRGDRVWPVDGVLDKSLIQGPTIVLFDGRTGAIRARWGANRFAMPHGLTVDQRGHLWLTDVALQQVYEVSHEGEPIMTLGERGVAGEITLTSTAPPT